MTTKKTLRVVWADGVREEVPIVAATSLELLAAKRLVRFMRRRAGAARAEKNVGHWAEAILEVS